MELLILNKGEESERSGRRFPIRKPMLSYKEYDNAQAVEIVLAGRVSSISPRARPRPRAIG